MKTLLAILSYEKANGIVARHWPWYERAGCDILGIGRQNSVVLWPAAVGTCGFIGKKDIGADSYVNGDNLPRLLVDTFEFCLSLTEYSHICLTEPDTIFLRRLRPVTGLLTTIAGGKTAGFMGKHYFHPPWCADRLTAQKIVRYGRRMIDAGLIEHGFPDRFLGLMADLYTIPIHAMASYTQNTIHPESPQERQMLGLISGCDFIHGVKDASVLAKIAAIYEPKN